MSNVPKFTWMELDIPVDQPTWPTASLVLLIYTNNEYLIPEAVPVGEIRVRHIYEDLPMEWHAWVTDYRDCTNKRWTGRYKSLQEAKDSVMSTVMGIFNGDQGA